MNFWTFIDRNAAGIFILICIGFLYGFGSCGQGGGCHVRLGPVSVQTGTNLDAGAP